MMTVPLTPPIAREMSSGDSVIEHMPSGCSMRHSCEWVEVSQNVTVWLVEYAINLPCFSSAMQEWWLLLGTGHSETVELVDGSN